ncbi:MAG: hypothetical protein AUJ20_14495 [Comamonadaceae bacterium CG1_02_60_18]|nr:MAG: hypothetical protein AUJ20_14495 [Comamonadaceae bacterium CG1_02_60_18]PIQ55109.1 MAG: hypothetical protein COW02_03680 [Comamonadaceae bacterium CG12_big_fil_rev_8_21_14_0_65_59_15]
MTTYSETFNPFSLMMEPERVLATVARSSQLRALRRHKLHPLDKPLIPLSAQALARQVELDDAACGNDNELPDLHDPDALDDYLLN